MHLRKKIASLFSLGRHQHPVDRIARYNAAVGGLALFPQVYKVWASRSVGDISFAAFFLIMVNSCIWLWYSLHRRSAQLFISSVCTLTASALLCLAFLYFG